MYSPGSIPSEIWTVNTDRIYSPNPPSLENLYFLAAGAELTGGPFNPTSFYSRVSVTDMTNDAKIWGATDPGGAADYIAARPAVVTSTGTVLVGQGEWGGNDAIVTRSTDYGKTWTEVYRLDKGSYVQGITESLDGTKIYAGLSRNGQIIVSEDDGQTWTPFSQLVPDFYGSGAKVTCFCELPNGDILIGAHGGAFDAAVVYRSSNNGATWEYETEGDAFSPLNYYWYGINRIYYHESTDTIWVLRSAVGSNTTLSYKAGAEKWTTYEITATNSNFGLEDGAGPSTVFDVIFNDAGIPEYISGVFTWNNGVAAPCVYQLNEEGTYDVHLGASETFEWPQYMYQLSDYREESIETPGVYPCGSQHLLRLNMGTVVDLGDLGAPFSPGDVVYIPDQIIPWTTWGSAEQLYIIATGMIRIPESSW